MTQDKLKEVLTVIRDSMDAEQVVVTGSAALYQYGLVLREPKDLDILLYRPTMKTIANLEFLQSANPASNQKNYPSEIDPNGFRRRFGVNIKGIDVDFFIVNALQPVSSTFIGMDLAKVNDIYKAKGYFSRSKDAHGTMEAVEILMSSYRHGMTTRLAEEASNALSRAMPAPPCKCATKVEAGE